MFFYRVHSATARAAEPEARREPVLGARQRILARGVRPLPT